jgi:hypothetical protein
LGAVTAIHWFYDRFVPSYHWLSSVLSGFPWLEPHQLFLVPQYRVITEYLPYSSSSDWLNSTGASFVQWFWGHQLFTHWLNAWIVTPCVLSIMPRNIGYKHSFKHFDRNLVFILLGIMKSKKRKIGS